MTPTELNLLREAVAELLVSRVHGGYLEDGSDTLAWIRRDDRRYANIDLQRNVATAFTDVGARKIARLSEAVRAGSDVRRRAVDTRTLSKWIASEIARFWSGGSGASVEDRETAFGYTLDEWFLSHAELQTHFVPCAILHQPASRFALGPVSFVHRSEFDFRDHGLLTEENVRFHFDGFFEHMDQRGADWIARVEVRGREPDQSVIAAELAVDIALGALQAVFGPRDTFRRFARTTGRMLPPRREQVAQVRGQTLISSAWTSAGFAISSSQFNDYIVRAREPLKSMGRRLSAYLSGAGTTPLLDEAWCNAAYWYHEALAEPLDTVGITKLETSIEVLFRATNTSGSTRRIRDGIHAFYGLAENDKINSKSVVTVEQLATAIVRARSQVLHGTWPTLSSDLPSFLGGVPLVFADVEHIARGFLFDMSDRIDAYTEAGESHDDVDSFLVWVNANRSVS